MVSAPVTVMLVDADPEYRGWARGPLEAEGFSVVEAATVHDAALAARDLAPSVCVFELPMQISDVAAVTAIRRAAPWVKIVVVAQNGNLGPAFDALKLGALGYVRKSADADALVQTIRAVLRDELVLPPRLMEALIDEISPQRTRRLGGETAALTRRQAEVARLLRDGLSTEEIAAELSISPVTVRRHISSLAAKLGAHDRAAIRSRLGRRPTR